MNVQSVDLPASVPHRRRFWRHFAEMVVVMLLSMAVLGAAISAVFALAGHANLLHFAALRGVLMTGYMVIGMALWMRHRRHGWERIAEMSAAMAAPYVVLVGPFLGGVIGKGAFLRGLRASTDRRPNRGVICSRGCSERPCDHVTHLVAAIIRAEEEGPMSERSRPGRSCGERSDRE